MMAAKETSTTFFIGTGYRVDVSKYDFLEANLPAPRPPPGISAADRRVRNLGTGVANSWSAGDVGGFGPLMQFCRRHPLLFSRAYAVRRPPRPRAIAQTGETLVANLENSLAPHELKRNRSEPAGGHAPGRTFPP